ARLQAWCSVSNAATKSAPTTTAAPTQAAGDHVIVPVLLGAGRALRAVRAPWPATVLGTTGYQGYSIAHIAFSRRDLPPSIDRDVTLDLETEPADFVRSERPDAWRELDVRRQVASLVANPDELASYATPFLEPAAVSTPRSFKPTASPSLEGS